MHQRRHSGQEYIRFRTLNLQRTILVWYPTKRGLVKLVENAEALSQSLLTGVTGDFKDGPEWLVEHERIGARRLLPKCGRLRLVGIYDLRCDHD